MSDEPQAVQDAREVMRNVNRGMARYVGGLLAATTAIVGLGVAGAGDAAMGIGVIGLMAISIGALPWRHITKQQKAMLVLKEWDGRELRASFDRFDESSVPEGDPRLEAARSVAQQVQALTASDDATDAMVERLMARLQRLVADHAAAAAAVAALSAAGAGSAGTGRLQAAAERMEAEITRILDGLSELYATLLEVEQGRAENAASLGDMLAWLQAEAEIARGVQPGAAAKAAAEQAEALRPAGAVRAKQPE